MQISRRVFYYEPVERDDDEIKKRLYELAMQFPRYGYWKLYYLMRNQGCKVNHKRIYRLYTELNLKMRRKTKKRKFIVEKQPLKISGRINQGWSIDFMSDSLQSGQRFRTFNAIDDFNREGLVVEADTALPATRIVCILEQLALKRGYPTYIRCDNGPELRSCALQNWAAAHNIELCFIEPGKPMQNGLIERFNGTFRREILNAYIFRSLQEVNQIAKQWLEEYNFIRPHAGIGNVAPCQYLNEKIL